jgi:predicted ATPase
MGVQPAQTNIPAALTELIGRGDAIAHVKDLLSAYRIVTLTGPGGIGKTVLGLETARRAFREFGGECQFVELASLSDPSLVPSTVAHVLGLTLSGAAIVAETVCRVLRNRKILLILDNCEHVVDAAAGMADAIVRLCPNVSVLATSRELLGVTGERVYRVPPLEVPLPGHVERDQILERSAVALFLARARALDSGFSTDPESMSEIARICRQLDGIPLAIEFAAARSGMLGVRQVASGLNDRFALLTTGRRTAVPRHRTLRATLDWSYELLPEPERSLLRQLAIFPAGLTLDAAAAVVGDFGIDPSAVTQGIASLVTKSLVTPDQSDDRWFLLETIRAYALEKLVQQGEQETAARRHARYFRDLLAPLTSGAGSRLTADELARVVREIDNVRAALEWSFSAAGDGATGIALTAAYAPVWGSLSLWAERGVWCERALRGFEPTTDQDARIQMWLRLALGTALWDTMGSANQARTILGSVLETADILDDQDVRARALAGLAGGSIFRGDYAGARAAAERLGPISRQIGDPAIIRVADRLMGVTLLNIGRPAEAQRHLEGALQSHVPADDPRHSLWYPSDHLAPTRALLARTLWLLGFAEKAYREAEASLEEARATDHKVAFCMASYFSICRIAPMMGDFTVAEQANARLIDSATDLNSLFWRTVGSFLQGKLMVERGEFESGAATLRGALDVCGRTGWRISFPEFKCSLGAALGGLERYDEALVAVNEGLADAAESAGGERWYFPELLRVKGDILQRRDPGSSAAAEDCFNEALIVAREQGALFWEARVAIGLARVRMAQGRQAEARQILAPVHDRFTEGFETTGLKSIRMLLGSL